MSVPLHVQAPQQHERATDCKKSDIDQKKVEGKKWNPLKRNKNNDDEE